MARGMRKKCPQCGQGPIYRKWITLHDNCPVCGLRLLANPGDLLGPLFFIDRVVFMIPFIALFGFGVVSTNLVTTSIIGTLVLLTMILTAPNRNGISLGIDYVLRRKGGDLRDREP